MAASSIKDLRQQTNDEHDPTLLAKRVELVDGSGNQMVSFPITGMVSSTNPIMVTDGTTVGVPAAEAHGQLMDTYLGVPYQYACGFKIYVGGNDITVSAVTKTALCDGTTAVIMDAGEITTIASAAFVGDVATFSPAITLTKNTFYLIMAYSGLGVLFTQYYHAMSPAMPINSTSFQWYCGHGGGADDNTNGYNILSITTASGSSGWTINSSGEGLVKASQSGTWNIGTVTTVSAVTNLSQLNGQTIAMNTGTRSAGTQRVTIATNDIVPCSQSGTWNIGTVTTLTGITNVVHVDDNAGSLTVDGTVTANAGTNLNTSALALESGGNLAAAATSLAILDDWDHTTLTDAAKVKIIDANHSKGSTVSMATGDGTKTDTISVPAVVCIIKRIIIDFSNHNRGNTIAIERDNSADSKQEDIVDATDKWQDTGYAEFPCWITCAASDKIKITVTNTAAIASNLDWRIDYIEATA